MSININVYFYLGWKPSTFLKKQTSGINKHPKNNEPFISKAKLEIDNGKSLCSESTTENRTTAINSFSQFLKERNEANISLDELTSNHIKAFVKWSLDNGRKLNYVRCNLRNLRSLINRINGKGKELFDGISTSNTQTDKRAVDENVIMELEERNLSQIPKKSFVLDIFLFCFYAMGIPLIDAAYLKKSQYRDNCIIYYRRKTHRQVKIRVEPKLKEIIDRLMPEDSPYLLPILTSEDKKEAKLQYKRFLQNYNRTLKKLSGEVKLGSKLTSYTPRHTWASIAYKNGVSINVISQALGHSNMKTTQTYIQEISGEQLSEANFVVMNCLEQKRGKTR